MAGRLQGFEISGKYDIIDRNVSYRECAAEY